jgi:hypothetical protein
VGLAVAMKYVGSKRVMLSSALGLVVLSRLISQTLLTELIAGSAALAWQVAQEHANPLIA